MTKVFQHEPWMVLGSCRDVSTALFFPPSVEDPHNRRERERRAMLVCASCPVLEPCRTYARNNYEQGIWGGETDEQRRAARRLMPPPPRPLSRRSRRRRKQVEVASGATG